MSVLHFNVPFDTYMLVLYNVRNVCVIAYSRGYIVQGRTCCDRKTSNIL